MDLARGILAVSFTAWGGTKTRQARLINFWACFRVIPEGERGIKIGDAYQEAIGLHYCAIDPGPTPRRSCWRNGHLDRRHFGTNLTIFVSQEGLQLCIPNAPSLSDYSCCG